VSGHRQFLARRKDPHPDIVARRLRRKDKRALGEIHLARDGLHFLRRESGGLRKHGQLVAFERGVGENVEVEVTIAAHWRLPIVDWRFRN
jgi:hypothetical protein